MIKLSQERNKSLLAVHGWSAVFLGLLLYAVILTGVASVFAKELGDWSSPLSEPVADPFRPGTDRMMREFAASVDPQYYEEFFFFPRAGDHSHGATGAAPRSRTHLPCGEHRH